MRTIQTAPMILAALVLHLRAVGVLEAASEPNELDFTRRLAEHRASSGYVKHNGTINYFVSDRNDSELTDSIQSKLLKVGPYEPQVRIINLSARLEKPVQIVVDPHRETMVEILPVRFESAAHPEVKSVQRPLGGILVSNPMMAGTKVNSNIDAGALRLIAGNPSRDNAAAPGAGVARKLQPSDRASDEAAARRERLQNAMRQYAASRKQDQRTR